MTDSSGPRPPQDSKKDSKDKAAERTACEPTEAVEGEAAEAVEMVSFPADCAQIVVGAIRGEIEKLEAELVDLRAEEERLREEHKEILKRIHAVDEDRKKRDDLIYALAHCGRS